MTTSHNFYCPFLNDLSKCDQKRENSPEKRPASQLLVTCFEVVIFTIQSSNNQLVVLESGAPNDGFLPNALKRCFRLSGVLLKFCRLILGCAIKFLSVRFF